MTQFVQVTIKSYDELNERVIRLHPDTITQLIPDNPMYANPQPDLMNAEKPTMCTAVRLTTGRLLMVLESADEIESQVEEIKHPPDKRFVTNGAKPTAQLLTEDLNPVAMSEQAQMKRRLKKQAPSKKAEAAATNDQYNDD